MYLSPKASRIRLREAQRARNNRAEIHQALSLGQISRRDLIRWGIMTTGGILVCKNGLSPLAPSAFADNVPTGTPPSPLFGARKFVSKMPRLNLQHPVPITKLVRGTETDAVFGGAFAGERNARRLSYHTDFSTPPPGTTKADFTNPITGKGPIEGRPPGEVFAHQRWDEFFPKVGYIFSLSQVAPGQNFFPGNDTIAHNGSAPSLAPDAVWTYATGHTGFNAPSGTLPPPLIKGRYGEPIITRVYNNLPTDRNQNGGFGRNQHQLHFHNAHNGAESDGAANVHHFPGTFYDYRWSTTLARRDKINIGASDPNTGGPDDGTGIVKVAGDFREYQGTMWAHDHRFFFTAENVYKGMLMMINYYSAKDRGNELIGGPNLRLPSGSKLGWGNIDFDVNLIISDAALDPEGQLFFDIFTTDGMIGDIPLVNSTYAPYMEVLPRKYRFRILAASMSRFWKFAIAGPTGSAVPFQFIANDGNLVVNPIPLTELDEQGIAERYDIVVDFSRFRVGDRLHLVDRLKQTSGNKPDGAVSLAQALQGDKNDPVLGAILQFRVVSQLESVDMPGAILRSTDPDPSVVPPVLTTQIPVVTPVRTRLVEFGRSGDGDSRNPVTGQCTPDCSEVVFNFPWTIRINGQEAHSMNANRVSLVIPKSGEIEHWTYVNGGGGWDHPIHLHFEEGITMNRGSAPIPATERLVRKDVWRLRPGGQVQFQIQFGEYGGSYVNHCHNTVHEDFALLMRIQLLVSGIQGSNPNPPQTLVTDTPNPTEDGIVFTTPEILPEGDPRVPPRPA
jgi:FtsP/CotA-like multicopper oxidase with cupredoxin domain